MGRNQEILIQKKGALRLEGVNTLTRSITEEWSSSALKVNAL
jgi:hypothetical protein